MTMILLGNQAPLQRAAGLTTEPGQAEPTPLDVLDGHTTTVVVPDDWDIPKIVAEVKQLWLYHSDAEPGWFTFHDTDPDTARRLEEALRREFGLPAPEGPTMLLTNAGLDFISKQMAGSASATAVAKWVALTANATAPAVTDTTLTAEIATASGGLVRAAAAYAHTASASTYTLTNTFTANGSDVLPVTIAKVGCFDAASAGNLVFSTLLSTTATLSASGDNLPLTWTVTV
jgi:hypothetical protein